jgi:hypothetical protein
MDGDERTDDRASNGPRQPGPGDRVGLGRVLEDHATEPGGRPMPGDVEVEEASDESFPASDPPAFAPGRPGRLTERSIAAERPDPGDAP